MLAYGALLNGIVSPSRSPEVGLRELLALPQAQLTSSLSCSLLLAALSLIYLTHSSLAIVRWFLTDK